MSFTELLEAARRRPPPDQLRLVHELVDEVARAPEDRLAASIGHLPGATYDVWFPEENAPAVAAALQALLDNTGA